MRFRCPGIGPRIVPGNASSSQSWSSDWATLNEFTTDQSVLTQLVIQRITVLSGKAININWGDGTDLDLSGETTNITKDYTSTGTYTITFSGDLDYIQFFEWMGQGAVLTGDLTNKRLPRYIEWFHFYTNNCYGDLDAMFRTLKYLNNLEIFHVGKASSVKFSGNVDIIQWPSKISDIHLESNQFTGNPLNWVLPDPMVSDEGHINLSDNLFSGIGTLELVEGISWIRATDSGLIINIGNWVIPSTLCSIYLVGTAAYGEISGWILPTVVRDNEGFNINLSGLNITGDLSSWILPDDGGAVGTSLEFNIINLSSCNVTGLPRGAYRHFKEYNFNGNNCSQTEVDSLLAAIDAYFAGGIVPLTDCTYDLAGDGMAAPSAAGLISRTSIINKYTAAGKVATINYYVDIAEPTGLTVSTNPAAGQTGIKLDWTDNTGGTCAYEVWESVAGGAFTLINTTAVGVTTYSRTVVIGSSVSYKVRAKDSMNNYSGYIQKTLTLGDELVDQVNWCASPVSSYWDKYSSANWSTDGTKLISNGSSGDLGRNSFWTNGKLYKVVFAITRTSGSVIPPYSTGNLGGITSSITYNMTGGVQTWLGLYSISFNGTITGLSIKEIIIT